MTAVYEIDGASMHYYMPKELDHHIAQSLCKELDHLVEAYCIKELILDFSETGFMDSSGIGVLIGRSKTMYFHGGSIQAIHLSSRVQKIFQAAGLEKIISMKKK
ncbi:MAG: STAS domain-containing protein [Lachnospiraceae bacterium]|nr:STAS domain-containing protein [Lachnospiraceae bacterium]